MSDKFETKMTAKKGRGIFATQVIKKDEQILEFTGPIIFFEEALKKSPDTCSNPLQIGLGVYMDIQAPGVLANHCCFPNAGIKNDRFLIALEDIYPGQEICYDYSTTMDEDHWTLICKCEHPHCRGIVKDFKYLPPDVQKKYSE
jgi:SET domain-containing protein